MTEEKKQKKKYVAKKVLFTSQGKINKGDEFYCTPTELSKFKKDKAV